MTFSDRMKELLEQGFAASKDLATKAGAKTRNLGEQGVLMLETRQLEGQAQRLLGRLGNLAFRSFTEGGRDSIGKDMPEVRVILAELSEVKSAIEHREAEIRSRRG